MCRPVRSGNPSVMSPPRSFLDDADHKLLNRLIRSTVTVSDGEWNALLACFRVRTLAKGEYLLRAGERAVWIAVVTRGVLREYYTGQRGDEATRTFCTHGTLSGSMYDLLSNDAAITNIQALETTRLLLLASRDFEAACSRNPQWHQAARRCAESVYKHKVRREFQMLTMDAAQRYGLLQRALGLVAGRIPLRHMASYLGITPEHLSRIRRRLKDRATQP